MSNQTSVMKWLHKTYKWVIKYYSHILLDCFIAAIAVKYIKVQQLSGNQFSSSHEIIFIYSYTFCYQKLNIWSFCVQALYEESFLLCFAFHSSGCTREKMNFQSQNLFAKHGMWENLFSDPRLNFTCKQVKEKNIE